ncbi:hypothetical protein Purlil1_12734 [Purpureocillium lilacinum]|uniref:AB hydrolase-1 domain-containing protein n=1 Tax=Purpureocillium lilacinum TaxID=33203 RepID=A0ABR0BG90_PURLI|nr:hypothetical protein Purlil1_12734 [Purpureocillium lilacinum]
MLRRSLFCVTAGILAAINAQTPPVATHSTGFDSSVQLTQEQIDRAQLSNTIANNVETVINFDRSQLVFGGPLEDDFYTIPHLGNGSTSDLKAGALLKVQRVTDTTAYTIPPNTALSRIMYTTSNINGTILPATAFVLWPYHPRRFMRPHEDNSGSAPVVLWAHGTSGYFASAAPSAHRSLFYGYTAPFTLALEGYAVVAADFAGLGVSKAWSGSTHAHQYLNSPAAARDSLYALRAARQAFPTQLSKEFIIMGHSQGGGVAWSAAELLRNAPHQLADLVEGHRGTIATSPTTDLFSGMPQFVLPPVGLALGSLYTGFNLSDWFTPLGIARTELLAELDGSTSVMTQLFSEEGKEFVRPDYNETSWYSAAYESLSNAGKKDFRGPLLVIHGTDDIYVSYNVTDQTARDTCASVPGSHLEFVTLPHVGHVPALDASRPYWMQWITDRFERRPFQRSGCFRTEIAGFLPAEQYQTKGTSFTQWAGRPEWSYETPLGL